MVVIMAATIISCSTAMLAAKNTTLCSTCTYGIVVFTSVFAKKRFTSKWWLSSKVKAWNFTKNKLLKLFNSMKAYFLFPGVNVNIIFREKNARKGTFYR